MSKEQELIFLNKKLEEAKIEKDEDAINYYTANIERLNQEKNIDLEPKIIYTKNKGLSKIEKLEKGNIRISSEYLNITPKISNTKLRLLLIDLQFDLALNDLGKKQQFDNINEILNCIESKQDENDLLLFLNEIYKLGETGKKFVEQIEQSKNNQKTSKETQLEISNMFRNEINRIKNDQQQLFKNNNFNTDNVYDIIARYKKCYDTIESSRGLIPKEQIEAYLEELESIIKDLEVKYELAENIAKSL